MRVHAEIGAGAEGNLRVRLTGDFQRPAHRGARLRRIPHIAFQKHQPCIGDGVLIDRLGRQEMRCAEKGVHRALAVRADQNEAAARWRFGIARGLREIDAHRAQIMGIDLAQLILGDLPDELAFRAEHRETGQGIGRRAAADFLPRSHLVVERDGTIGIDQGHAALGQVLFGDEIVGRAGEHIDDGIADG